MALFGTLFKACVAALLLALPAAAQAEAAEFSVRRGLNLDQWVTWPQEPSWGEPDVLDPYPEWRKFVSTDDLAALKAAGFDFLRMPVDPAPFLSPRTEAFRERLFEDVLESARMINRAGLKVVVDMHLIHSEGPAAGMERILSEETAFEAYLDLVRRMARMLSREPADQVAFELMNEPGTECDADGAAALRERQKRLHAAARAAATRLTLVLTGGCMSSADGLAEVDPDDYPDDNVIWTFHSYEPFLLTHQGATWAGDFVRYVTGLPFPIDSVPRDELEAAMERVRERIRAEAPAARRAGMLSYFDEQMSLIDTPRKLETAMARPFETIIDWAARNRIAADRILLGEFGMIRQEYGQDFQVPPAARAAYSEKMIAHAEKAGFAWSMWSYGGAFGVVDEFDGRKAEPDVMEMVRGLKR